MQTIKIKNSIEYNINFCYHVFSCVFDQMSLRDVDKQTLLFIPRSLWDVPCDHYASCKHELGWQQYCYRIVDHFMQMRDLIQHKDDIKSLDLLDLMVWGVYNTNIIDIILTIYTPMSVSNINNDLQRDFPMIQKEFAKYLKLNEDEKTNI